MRNHALDHLLEEAMPIDAIFAELIKKWFLPKVKLDIIEELFLLMQGKVLR